MPPTPKEDRPDTSLFASQNHVLKGIRATKLNWSNSTKKQVILRLSKDMKYLTYKKERGDQDSCWNKLKPGGKQCIEDIADFTYGAVSSTFSRL